MSSDSFCLSQRVQLKSLTGAHRSALRFLFYMVSQVIPNSRFLHVRNHFILHSLTHTTLFCFTAQTVTPSMFDVSFSIPSQKVILHQWLTRNQQPHLPAAIVSLAAIFHITATLQRCYGSPTWLGVSCTVLGCMFSRPENKACVDVQLTVSFHDSLVVV